MNQISSVVAKSVFAEHKGQIDKTIKKEVDDTLNHNKSANDQFLKTVNEWSNHLSTCTLRNNEKITVPSDRYLVIAIWR